MAWLLVFFGSILAGTVQTVTGFGAGVVMIMVLSRLFELTVAPSLSTTICITLSASLAWRFRKDINFKLVIVPAIPYLTMSVCVISLLRYMNVTVLAVVFGVFLMVLSVYFLLFESRVHLQANYPIALLCGAVSGVFAGLFGVGGPLISLYYITITKSRATYIATLQFFFVLSSFTALTTRVLQGYYTLDLLPYTIVGILGIAAGKHLGLMVVEKLDGAKLKKIIYVFVGISGVINVIQNLPL